MKSLFIKLFLLLVILLNVLTLNPSTAQANDDSQTDSKPHSFDQMGFEIEIGDRHFAEIIQYFDTTQIEQKIQSILTTPDANIPEKQKNSILKTRIKMFHILARSIDRYLENENAFNSLPLNIQAELSQGLNLNKKTELAQNSQQFALVDSQGQSIDQTTLANIAQNTERKPVIRESGLILPHAHQTTQSPSGLIIPKDAQLSHDFISANAHLYQRSDWPVVFERWKRLPFEQKLELIQFKYLPRQTLASLILSLDLYQNTKKPDFFKTYLPLKDDAPDWFKDYEMDFDGVQDNISIEIRANGPKPVQTALDLLNSMFKRLRINPDRSTYANQSRLDYGLHIHLGQKDKPDSRIDFSKNPRVLGKSIQFFQKYKLLTILRLFAANPEANIQILRSYIETKSLKLPSGTTQNEFYLPLETKGILRLINASHIELREITGDARQVLSELHTLLNLDEQAALTEITKLTQNILNKQPEILYSIGKKNPFILLELEDNLTSRTKDAVVEFINKHYVTDEYGFSDLAQEVKSLSPQGVYNFLLSMTPLLATNEYLTSKFSIYLLPLINKLYSEDSILAQKIDLYLIEKKLYAILFELKTRNPEILRQKVSILTHLIQDSHSPFLKYLFQLLDQYQYGTDEKLTYELKPLLNIKDIGPLASIAVNRTQIYFLNQDAIEQIMKTQIQRGQRQLESYFARLLNTYYKYDYNQPEAIKIAQYLERHLILLNNRSLNEQFIKYKSLKVGGRCEGLF